MGEIPRPIVGLALLQKQCYKSAMHKKCAVCGKVVRVANTPFCSLRCRTIDLGNWLGDTYRVATDSERVDERAEIPIVSLGSKIFVN